MRGGVELRQHRTTHRHSQSSSPGTGDGTPRVLLQHYWHATLNVKVLCFLGIILSLMGIAKWNNIDSAKPLQLHYDGRDGCPLNSRCTFTLHVEKAMQPPIS